ncbi:MAG: hypothetical protein IJT97_10800 [Bacteroidaceae bacterium]|nr:hypothetical protein [Bacteroidaceae bacterium]
MHRVCGFGAHFISAYTRLNGFGLFPFTLFAENCSAHQTLNSFRIKPFNTWQQTGENRSETGRNCRTCPFSNKTVYPIALQTNPPTFAPSIQRKGS